MEPTNEQNEEFIKLLHTYNANINEDLFWFMRYCHYHVLTMKNAGLSFTEICQLVRKAAEIFPENHLFYNGRYPVDKNGYFHLQEQDGDDNDPVLYAKVFIGDITKYECNRFRTYGRIPYKFDDKIPKKSYEIYESGKKYRSSDWVFDYENKEK